MSRTERELVRQEHPVIAPAPPDQQTARQARSFWETYGARLAVLGAVIFNAIALWPETLSATRPNDAVAHESWVRWAAERIAAGHSPLDGWLPQLGLGAPLFHQYEVLPHIMGGLVASFTDAAVVTRWSNYLLVATWPIAVYVGGKLLGLGPRAAAISAVVSSLVASQPSFGLEWSSYLFRGYGLWAQAFGMWLIPLALGYSWRAITTGRTLALSAIVLAATICCHFLWGWVALLWMAVVVAAGAARFVPRLFNALLVGAGALAASAWLLVPLVTDLRFVGRAQLTDRELFNSYGAKRILEWLVTGELLDHGRTRLPIVSLLALAGAVVCIVRFREPLFRCLLLFTGIALVLFFGHTTFGDAINLVPGIGELPVHRFLGIVQLGAILLAGVGGSALVSWFTERVRDRNLPNPKVVFAIGAVAALALFAPAWIERADYADGNREGLTHQHNATRLVSAFDSLVADARHLGPGRIFAGNQIDGGRTFTVGLARAYQEVTQTGALGVGYLGTTSSLSADTEVAFDPRIVGLFDLYGVHYLILPEDNDPKASAALIRTRGPYSLWRVGSGGYMHLFDTVGPAIHADRGNLGERTIGYLRSDLPAEFATRPIAFDSDTAGAPTVVSNEAPGTAPGTVTKEHNRPTDGHFKASVTAAREAVVVLAASYHPRWTATVDGRPAKIQMVAPSFVAVRVPAGTHSVAFQYEPYPGGNYAWLFAAGALGIIGLALIDRRRRLSF